jgi:hypothetical protein
VQHFEAKAAEFMDEITERGVTVANTTDVFSTVIN